MSVDELIRERLETLVEPVRDPDALVAAIEARGQEPRRRRARPMLAAAAVIVAVAAVGGAVWLGGEPQREVVAGPDDTEPTDATGAPSAQAEVSVSGERLGPLQVTTSPLEPYDGALARHVLTLTNRSDRPVFVGDIRASVRLGAEQNRRSDVFIATDGCGGRDSWTDPGICADEWQPVGEIAAGASVRVGVTLWSGLPDMFPLDRGDRVFRFRVLYRDEPFEVPAQEGPVGDIVLTYRNLTALEGDPSTAPADVAGAPLTARLELSSTTVQAGATLDGEVVVQNDTGAPVSVEGCGPYSVTLRGDGVEQVDPSAPCLVTSILPVGASRWPVTVWASHLMCGAGDVPPCGPDGFAPGLPPGDYTVTVTASPGAPTPPDVEITVTPAP